LHDLKHLPRQEESREGSLARITVCDFAGGGDGWSFGGDGGLEGGLGAGGGGGEGGCASARNACAESLPGNKERAMLATSKCAFVSGGGGSGFDGGG
jgi:hypothetical protein